MSSEEGLQDKLDKLEIAPILRQVKVLDCHLPLNLNPFYDELVHMSGEKREFVARQNITNTKVPTSLECGVRPPNCRRCRLRRQSTSVLDEYKTPATLSSVSPESSLTTLSRTTLGVQRQPLKRSPVVGANKKIILREPVLRALQMCCSNMHANGSRKLQSPSITTTSVSASILSSRSVRNEISPAFPIGEQRNLSQAVTTRGMTDFRDLISECQHLLDHDVEFGGRQRSIGRHGSNNFNKMQTHTPIVVSQTLGDGRRHSFCNTILTADFPLFNPSSNIPSRTSSPLPEQSTVTHASTSCSQQAGNRATAGSCDDVTIDELASYFETLVHIPKKMSSMAEMMYI